MGSKSKPEKLRFRGYRGCHCLKCEVGSFSHALTYNHFSFCIQWSRPPELAVGIVGSFKALLPWLHFSDSDTLSKIYADYGLRGIWRMDGGWRIWSVSNKCSGEASVWRQRQRGT